MSSCRDGNKKGNERESVFSASGCFKLKDQSISDPDTAINNADSFEYWLEDAL